MANQRRIPIQDVPATSHFSFLYGRYHLSPWVIPYFSTTMSLSEAADSLKLVSEFPGADKITWRIDELYQREIDWPRVERQIVPYLHSVDQPQFFNSLTIALLPLGDDSSSLPRSFEHGNAWLAPPLDRPDGFARTLDVGPIACGFWEPWNDPAQLNGKTGRVRWNPKQVFAVALDGQHRLAAIQEFARNPGISHQQLNDTHVSVILVVLSEELGFSAPRKSPLVDVLRRIFIDLNKHAKIPTRTRTILLDDKDPTSVCVRALMGDSISETFHELEGDSPRLPLSLVDWHSEQAKFEGGPYVTTTLGLDWAIVALLGAKPVSDFTDYNVIRKQVKALSKALDLDLSEADRRLETLASVELSPFSYSEDENNNELKQIEDAFVRLWNPVFTELLTRFKPYEEFIEIRKEKQTFTLGFMTWYRLYEKKKKDKFEGRATVEYKQFLGRLANERTPVTEKQLIAKLQALDSHKHGSLAFTVTFQRAYFLAFNDLRKIIEDDHLDELEDVEIPDFDAEDWNERSLDDDDGNAGVVNSGDESRLRTSAERFVQAMNSLTSSIPGFLDPECVFDGPNGSDRFWLGTLLTADHGVDFTQGASNRAKEIIFWAVAMQWYDEIVDPDQSSSFDEFWSAVVEEDTNFAKRVKRSVGRFCDQETSAAGRILKARGLDVTDEDSREEEARLRMEWLWTGLDL